MTVSAIIDASPDVVFDRVADLSRMRELSPEANRFEWLNADGPLVGRRFRGWNRLGSLQTLRLPIHLKLLGPFLGVRWLQLKLGMGATLRRLRRELEQQGAALDG